MIHPWHIWVIIALVFFIIEFFTSGFAVACFSIGALAAAIGSACHGSLLWQIILFAVFSFLAFVFVRPLVLKYFFKKNGDKQTNVNALIGKRGKVSSDIDPEKGYGRVAEGFFLVFCDMEADAFNRCQDFVEVEESCAYGFEVRFIPVTFVIGKNVFPVSACRHVVEDEVPEKVLGGTKMKYAEI